VLTILGVILYLRVGWVVGNAGLLGALLIITFGFLISTCTALAMSSITTNIRIGAGGAYAVIAQSLGLEVGGAVGIPRYLSQALAVTMYIFGFREGWRFIFPDHPTLAVDLAVFLLLFVIAYISADFAIKTQYLIMAVIVGSLVSVATAAGMGSMQQGLSEVPLWGDFAGAPETGFEGTTFWMVFAVFFPATTGIMAGANMSGDLEDPKRSIPKGTLWAIGVSYVIYVLTAIWLATSATQEELLNNYTVMMDKAYWPFAVIAGLLGATFSSALASLVGSARILYAMAEHQLVPGKDWLAELSDNYEPRHAMMMTGGIILLSIMLRDLNAVAPLITMFFLVTYAMICGALLLEQELDMVSFRPLFRVPRWVALAGLVGAVGSMVIINPTITIISVVVTLGFYVYLTGRELAAPFEDVRSGLFEALAEWSAQRVHELPDMSERAWKPKLLVPVETGRQLPASPEFLRDLTYPNGSLTLVGFTEEWTERNSDERLNRLERRFREKGIFTSTPRIEKETFREGIKLSLPMTRGLFGPNSLFLELPEGPERDEDLAYIIDQARHFSLGVYLFLDANQKLKQGESVNVWVSDMSPDWNPRNKPVSLDLSLLVGYKLRRNWNADLRVLSGVQEKKHIDSGRRFLEGFLHQARLDDCELSLQQGSFDEVLEDAPAADLEIFGLPENFDDFSFMRELQAKTDTACLFVEGTGDENALA
jgi:amino acid transporter